MVPTPSRGFILVAITDCRRRDRHVSGKVVLEYKPPSPKKKDEPSSDPGELFGPLHVSIELVGNLFAKVGIDHGTTDTSIWRWHVDERELFRRRVILYDGPIRLSSQSTIQYAFDINFPEKPEDKTVGTPTESLPPTLSADFSRLQDRGKVNVTYQLHAEVTMPGIDVRAVSRGSTLALRYDRPSQHAPAPTENSGVFVQSYTIRSVSLLPPIQQPRGLRALFGRKKDGSDFCFSLHLTSFPTCLHVGQPITFKLSAVAHAEASSTDMIPEVHLKRCRIIFRTLTTVYTRDIGSSTSATSGPVKEELNLSSTIAPSGPILGGTNSDAHAKWITTAPIQDVVGTFHTDNIRRCYTVQVDVEATVLKERVKIKTGFPLFIQAGTPLNLPEQLPREKSTSANSRQGDTSNERFVTWTKYQIDDLHDELTGKKRWGALSERMKNLNSGISFY